MINIYYTQLQGQPSQEEASTRGRLLLGHILQSHFPGFHLSDICYTENGRPYISQDFDFNISHSGNLVVCAFAAGSKVGIDIEECKPIAISHYRDYFSEAEWKKIKGASDPLAAFYENWTAKEAFVKATGEGLTEHLANIQFKKGKIRFKNRNWHLRSINNFQGYQCSIVSSNHPISIALKEILFNNLKS